MAPEANKVLVSHILRYTADPIRDEWLNIGVLLFDPATGDFAARVIEEEREFARLRRLQPMADEEVVRLIREHFEDHFGGLVRQARADAKGTMTEFRKLVDKWEGTLSTGVQLSPQRGVHAQDLETELNRLYTEHVGLERGRRRVGAPGSRAAIRDYCSQVWHEAKLWQRIEKSQRVAEYTFPGDPMRIDYGYRRNGTRGFMQTLSVSRSPMSCKEYAYTAKYITQRGLYGTEFAAVTDVTLDNANLRHCFVRDTLREAGIEPIPLIGFATWVAKLKPTLLQ